MLLFDLIIINLVVFYVNDKQFLNIGFLSYINLFWIVSTYFTGFYKIHRNTIVYRLLSQIAIQTSVFFFGYFTYFGIFHEGEVVNNQLLIFATIIIGIISLKFLSFYALKQYRSQGKNYRNVVILGIDETSKEVIDLFKKRIDLGYRYFGFFSDRNTNQKGQLGTLKESFNYILENGIDEIYCTISDLNKDEVKEFTKFANTHSRVIKLIPNSNELYSKNLNAEYYNNTLVLNVKKLPLDIAENRVLKRTFDIVFSLLIIVFFMSWLTPILWILIKLESRGPALFKQDREGLGGYQFTCYKFRSMKQNAVSDLSHAKKMTIELPWSGPL